MTAVDDGDLIECLDALASDRSEASRVAAVHPDHESHTGRVTRYELRDRTGVLHAVHVRVDGPSGKRMWWEDPTAVVVSACPSPTCRSMGSIGSSPVGA